MSDMAAKSASESVREKEVKRQPAARSVRETATLRQDAGHALRGLCMGAADVVPGVSGGTVALILGIYSRLVTAISHVDPKLFRFLGHRKWSAAMAYLDLRFLGALGVGILCGFISMTVLMNRLLTTAVTRSLTMALFFGAILASSAIIATLVHPRNVRQLVNAWLLGVLGAAAAYWVSTLQSGPSAAADPSLAFLFFSGSIAICAMILPGISGAMILLILGVYVHLTDIPHALLRGEKVGDHLLMIGAFALGAMISLILFSKVLRWLLFTHRSSTLAVLCGFMIGALPKIWPFQHDLTPEIEKFKYKTFAPYWPVHLDSSVLSVLAAMTVAAAAIFTVDYFMRRQSRHVGP